MGIAEKQTVGSGGVDNFFREQSGGDGADGSAHAVHAEGIQRVIVAEFALNDRNRDVADDGDDHADKHGIHRIDKTAGGRDGNETGHGPCCRAQNGRRAVVPPFNQSPGDAGGSRGDMCGHKSIGGQAIGGQGAARVEAEPANPQKSGAQNGKGQIMRPNGFMVVADSFAQH